jgi:ketosteroid isomerase-like protein
MTVDLVARARRATDLFNETVGRGITEPDEELLSLWTDAPLIVPLRAAMEGTEYSGEDALERFAEETVTSWERLSLELETVSELGGENVLAVGRLSGVGRETGISVDGSFAFLFSFQGGRISALRTFASEDDARRAAP